jgi:soluble lytic murein transglycosylase
MDLNFRTLVFSACCWFVLTPVNSAAATLEEQRNRFLEAEKALQKGENQRFQTLKSSIPEYPLYPYLEYQELKRNIATKSTSEIGDFLDRYPRTPLAEQLRNAWLDHLADRGRWKSYLNFYQASANTRRHCLYLQGLIKTGQKTAALDKVEPLWLHGRSQPKACDQVFQTWRQAGRLSSELVWQRIELAMDNRQTSLATYLQRFLPKTERKWLDIWLHLHRQPEELAKTSQLDIPSPLQQKILVHSVKRLAWKDSEQARSNWFRLSKLHTFSTALQERAAKVLTQAMIKEDHPNLLEFLDTVKPSQENWQLAEIRLRAALAQHDWARLLHWIGELPEELKEKESWRYWRARALGERGEDPHVVKQLLQDLAQERSYYGFLAADRLGASYNLSHQPLNVDETRLSELANDPGLKRARELFLLGRMIPARREWASAVRELDKESLKAVAKLAYDWNWHARSIFALARAEFWHDLELRFPLEYRDYIDTRVSKNNLDIAWVFAVIRQESAFVRDAHSHAGALGLMQLMPRTARSEARRLKRRRPGTQDLLEPTTNIELGTAHLRRVMDKVDQNEVLATAAYNAGLHRVRTWLPEDKVAADLWVETVPFSETRRYLKRVLSYKVIYQKRLGLEPQRIKESMPHIGPDKSSTDTKGSQRVSAG